jgi:predicted dienelactone hydrolase
VVQTGFASALSGTNAQLDQEEEIMFTRKHLFLVLMIAALMLPALASLPSARAQDGPQAVGLRPDAPPYALHGPYWVGTRDYIIDPEAERPVGITVWYPALNPDGVEESVEYPIARINLLQDITTPDTKLKHSGRAILNALPDTSAGPYPLVLYSHGFTAWRQGWAYLLEHIASWGFVVIAPDHLGEVPSEGVVGQWSNYITRPQDIDRAIAYAEGALIVSGGDLENMIDTELIGVTGHSFGGWTAVLEGGALLNSTSWETWCANLPSSSENSDCQALDYRDQMAQMIGLDQPPEGLWPALGDPRVDAIVDMANGISWFFGEEGLAAVKVPTLAMIGSADDITSAPDEGVFAVYPNISSPQKALVVLENAGHEIFIDKCASMPWAVDMGLGGLCMDLVWDMDRAHDLTNHFVTAFLLATLKGDPDAAAALAADQVAFPGIEYQVQGF